MSSSSVPALIAVDIGNSRIKLGLFEPERREPFATLDLPITDRTGQFGGDRLAAWCGQHVRCDAAWLVASVHRGAAERFATAVKDLATKSGARWALRRITHRDVPIPILVDEPERVGIDRLLAALAADRLRRPDRAAIVVDLGSAITVDLVQADGAFAGGAILPGIAMSAGALHEQTDALPRVTADRLDRPPDPLGKSTVAAIKSGLYWGAVGAIRELIARLSAGQAEPPDVFLTGGASPQVAELLAMSDPCDDGASVRWPIRHVPHLVLAGIALVDQAAE